MSFKKNIFSNVVLTSSTILLPLITFPYITRTLSNEGLGNFFFIDSFTQYFILFAALGIPLYGIREIAKNRKDKVYISKLVIELVLLQFILSLFYVLLFFCLGFLLPKLINNIELIKIGALMIIANSFLIEWFYQGIENFSYITIRSLIIKTLSVIAILVFVKGTNDFTTYYFILTSVVIANASLNFGYFLKKHFHSKSFKINVRKHIKPLLILFSINASISVYVILDSIILGYFTDAVNVSYYNIPLKLVKIYWMVIAGIGMVFIPRISSLYQNENYDEIRNLMTKSISIVLLLSLPFSFFCLVMPEQIIMIISGSKYVKSSVALQVLSVIPLIIGLCNIFGTQFLLPIGKERKILLATIIGLVVSITSNVSLIPNLKFLGSAIAAVAAELSVLIFIFWSAKKEIKIDVDFKLLIQIFTSLFFTLIANIICNDFFNGIYLVLITVVSYIVFFLLSQIFFRNPFIAQLINLKAVVKKNKLF
jgi:O-antigen/teichoic acid export membrane protein